MRSSFRQCKGFQGRTGKAPDSCYSFWIGATLSILGAFADTDLASTRSFLLNECQSDPRIGGFSKHPNSSPDLLHSFYSLCWLSMAREEEEASEGKCLPQDEPTSFQGLNSIDVLLGVCKNKSPRFKSLPSKEK